MKDIVKEIAVSALLLLITGCGGGGGDSGGSVQSEQNTQATSLMENPLEFPKESSSYIEHSLLIDANHYDSVDSNLFIKVYTENNETLYLGSMYKQPFPLNVTLPATERNVLYQIFTINIADNIYFGELEL